MTKVNVKLTSFYSKAKDKFEFYSGDVKIEGAPLLSEVGFTDLKKFALDILFEAAYFNVDNPEYNIGTFKGEDYLGNLKIRYCKKPSLGERDELIKNINNLDLNRRAKNLVKICLKGKKFFETE